MTGPKYRSSNGKGYLHPTRPGTWDGMTTILGNGLPMPWYGAWKAKVTATWAVEHKNEWINLPDAAAVDLLKRAADRVRDAAGDRGTALHNVAEALLGDQQPAEYDLVVCDGYVEGLRKFIDAWDPQLELSEATTYNHDLRIAGTLDFYGTLGTRPDLGHVILDWKTGKNIGLKEALQQVGYATATHIVLADDSEQPMPPVDHAYLVHLHDDGTFDLIEAYIDEETIEALRCAVGVARAAGREGRFLSSPIKPAAGARLLAPTPTPAPATGDTVGDRRQWLKDRIAALGADGMAQLAATWPAGVPTLKASDTHLPWQLARIDEAVAAVEAAAGRPFPDTDPQVTAERAAYEASLVPFDDPRVTELADLLRTLPVDLLADIEAQAAEHQIPRLTSGKVTVDQLALLTDAATAADAERRSRVDNLDARFQRWGADEATAGELCALVDIADLEHVTAAQAVSLHALLDGIDADLLSIVATDDGFEVTALPAAEARAVALHGSKSDVLRVAKGLADTHGFDKPRSTAQALGHPILAALLCAAA